MLGTVDTAGHVSHVDKGMSLGSSTTLLMSLSRPRALCPVNRWVNFFSNRLFDLCLEKYLAQPFFQKSSDRGSCFPHFDTMDKL